MNGFKQRVIPNAAKRNEESVVIWDSPSTFCLQREDCLNIQSLWQGFDVFALMHALHNIKGSPRRLPSVGSSR